MNRQVWLENSEKDHMTDEEIVEHLQSQLSKLHPDYKIPEIFAKEAVNLRGKYTIFFSSALLRDLDRWNKQTVISMFSEALTQVQDSEGIFKAIDQHDNPDDIFKKKNESA